MLQAVIGLSIPGVREQEIRLIGVKPMAAGASMKHSSRRTVGSIPLVQLSAAAIPAATGILIPIPNHVVKLIGAAAVGIIWIVPAAAMLAAGGKQTVGAAG